MKKLKIYRVNAFTNQSFYGNPAVVIKTDDLTDSEMQKTAAEMNVSETAFISKSQKGDFQLRWFTPKVEVKLCGHATIASLHYLKETKYLHDRSVDFDTCSGIIRCYIKDDGYYMQIPEFTLEKFDHHIEILSALGLSEDDTTGSQIIQDNGYLYTQVKSLEILGGLKPDFQQLINISQNSPARAHVVYTTETKQPESAAHLRFFDPVEGINEDPVTGSANGPLIKVLMENGVTDHTDDLQLQFEQGDFMDRPGRVKVIYKNGRIFIAGQAVTVLKGVYFI